MTIEETYPLHRCIFRNDVDGLNNILKDEEIRKQINSKDNHGNTPIHLALMLDRRNCIISLIKNGCDCVSRNNFGWNPLEEATMLGDLDLIEKLAYKKFKTFFDFFSKKGGVIDKWNENLPNCHFRYQIKIKSKIPLLSKICMRDVENFYKKGNNFRMDLGFSGIDFHGMPRMVKGNLTMLMSINNDGTSQLYLLDNKAKSYTELFPKPSQRIIISYLKSKMNVKTLYKFSNDNSTLRVKKKNTNGFSIKGNKKRVIQINGDKKYNTDIFKFKDAQLIVRKRDNEQIIGDYKSHIKTTVKDIDKSLNHKSTISTELVNSDENLKKLANDLINNNEIQNDSDNDDDESEIDESDAESTSSSSTPESVKPTIDPDNDFKKMVIDNLYSFSRVNTEISDKIVQMIIHGNDANGNPITNNDILFIDQNFPFFFISYLKEKRLPEDQQAKLEEIYITVVRNGNYKEFKKRVKQSEYLENFRKSESVYNMVYNITRDCYNTISTTNQSSSSSTSSLSSTSSSTSHSFITLSRKNKRTPIKREPVTEETYFDSASTENLHLGRIMEISEEKKLIKNLAKFWLTKEDAFPLNSYHVKPLIDIICLIIYDQIHVKEGENKDDQKIYYNVSNRIFKEIEGTKRFPLKFEIPIYAATAFQCKFLDVNTEPPSDDLFKIPEDYVYDDNVSFKFMK